MIHGVQLRRVHVYEGAWRRCNLGDELRNSLQMELTSLAAAALCGRYNCQHRSAAPTTHLAPRNLHSYIDTQLLSAPIKLPTCGSDRGTVAHFHSNSRRPPLLFRISSANLFFCTSHAVRKLLSIQLAFFPLSLFGNCEKNRRRRPLLITIVIIAAISRPSTIRLLRAVN